MIGCCPGIQVNEGAKYKLKLTKVERSLQTKYVTNSFFRNETFPELTLVHTGTPLVFSPIPIRRGSLTFRIGIPRTLEGTSGRSRALGNNLSRSE